MADNEYEYDDEPRPRMSTLRVVGITLAAVFGVLLLIGVATDAAPQADDLAQPQQAPVTAPAAAPTTVTSVQTVEVPVPTLPDACVDYLAQVDAVTDAIVEYEGIVGGNAPDSLRDGLEALVMNDPQQINESITAFSQMQLQASGPLQTIMFAQRDLDLADAACTDAIGD